MNNRTRNKAPTISDFQLDEFQQAVQWRTGFPLPDGRYLGFSEDGFKGGHWKAGPGRDKRVQAVLDHASPANKVILELGCCEGVLTVQLAAVCKKVVAIDVRPRNIACALIRAYLHGVNNCEFHVGDVRDLDERIGRFDILFHSGLLYHLKNPLEHLFLMRSVADVLLLETHYGDPGRQYLQKTSTTFQDKAYEAYLYEEHGWNDALSGMDEYSLWLSRQVLLDALRNFGFDTVKVLFDEQTPLGCRIGLLAGRTSKFNWKSVLGKSL